MSDWRHSRKELYTEEEAAAELGITVTRLHQLLDKHIFTQGRRREKGIEYTSTDLVLLDFWNKSGESPPDGRLLQMPRRNNKVR